VRYIELIARVAPADVERASDVLRDVTGADTWNERPFAQPDLESDAMVDGRAAATVHAYAREAQAAAEADARLALVRHEIPAELTVRLVDEEDWAESWKEHFHVEHIGDRIVVVPTWRTYHARPGDVVIALDPGMAFGTGQHGTTRMCLESLERRVRPGDRVLDVGCGSGILSIAAAKLGAAAVDAVDVDADCVRITSENARLNGVDVRAALGSLGSAWPFGEAAAGYDAVVANVIARVIIDLAPDLVGALAPSGRLIVSGVIAEREEEVRDALAAAGARVDGVRAAGEWRCIEAVRA